MSITRHPTLLNHIYTYKEELSNKPTLVLIHGLMGDLNNLGMLARYFDKYFNVLRLDLINHGRSFYRDQMDYHEMSKSIIDLCDHLGIREIIPIGHSMGAKVAMRVAFNYSDRCKGLVVLDMCPMVYTGRAHDNIFYSLNLVKDAQSQTSSEARAILEQNLDQPDVRFFLLKSFTNEEPHRFLFNLPILEAEYDRIGTWEESTFAKEVSFIFGGISPYLKEGGREAIAKQFPNHSLSIVEGASHWLHAEQPKQVISIIAKYFTKLGYSV